MIDYTARNRIYLDVMEQARQCTEAKAPGQHEAVNRCVDSRVYFAVLYEMNMLQCMEFEHMRCMDEDN